MVVSFAWTEPYLCSFVNPIASALDFRRASENVLLYLYGKQRKISLEKVQEKGRAIGVRKQFLLCAHLSISFLLTSCTPSSCSSQQTGTKGDFIGLQQLDMMRIFFFQSHWPCIIQLKAILSPSTVLFMYECCGFFFKIISLISVFSSDWWDLVPSEDGIFLILGTRNRAELAESHYMGISARGPPGNFQSIKK